MKLFAAVSLAFFCLFALRIWINFEGFFLLLRSKGRDEDFKVPIIGGLRYEADEGRKCGPVHLPELIQKLKQGRWLIKGIPV